MNRAPREHDVVEFSRKQPRSGTDFGSEGHGSPWPAGTQGVIVHTSSDSEHFEVEIVGEQGVTRDIVGCRGEDLTVVRVDPSADIAL